MRGARLALLVCFLCLASLAATGCARRAGGFTVAGSTSVQPFAEMLSEEYTAAHPEEHVSVQGGGSSAGIEAVTSGAAEIGMSSRELKGDERKLVRVEIARDAIAVVDNPANPVRNLTTEQVRKIFSGQIRSWSEVGGPDREIHVVTREEGSGTRGAFQDLVLGKDVDVDPGALVQDSNGAVRQLVSSDPNAIGYISLGLVNEAVRAISLDGVAPTAEHVNAGTYKLVRPFLFVLRPGSESSAAGFIQYVLSPEGQRSLAHEGLLSPSGGK